MKPEDLLIRGPGLGNDRDATGRRMRRLLSCLAVVLVVGVCQPASGEEQKQIEAVPRVAVALGGGAALGLSHIGFLRWMEEHHVPIRAVAGTSMGGLIGGLYATGFTPAEIDTFIRRIDWDRALEVAPAYTQLSFRRKADRRDFPNPLELGLRHGKLNLPPGVSAGHGVGLLISQLTAPYGELNSFDDLPTPFRCTAVDLIRGEGVTFDRGSLFDALRSTMSIPAYFAPWKIGNKLLVDGGMLDNLPVDVAQKMGADVVIAVELETPPLEAMPRLNLLGVAQRSISVIISNNERRNMALADVLVMPDLRGFSSTDYRRYADLIELGHAAAERKARQLLAYAVSDEEWRRYVGARAARRKRAPERIEYADLKGVDEKYRPLVERRKAEFQSVPADTAIIDKKLSVATENGRFASADYSFVQDDGRDGIAVRLHEKTYAPPLADFAILIDANQRDGAKFGAGTRLTFLDLGGALSELRVDLNAGGLNQAAVEYYWRPGARSFFFAPNYTIRADSLPYYRGHNETGRVSTLESAGGADAGVVLGRTTEWRVGYAMEHTSFRVASGEAPFGNFSGRWSLLRTQFMHDGQNAAAIASRGFRALLKADYAITAPAGMRAWTLKLEAQTVWAKQLAPKYRVLVKMNGGWTSKDEFIGRPFTLGGEASLTALARFQMLGNQYYYSSAMALRALTHGALPIHAALLWEAGKAWSTGPTKPFQDGAIGVVSETPLGVLFCGYGMGEGGERKFFFHLGRLY